MAVLLMLALCIHAGDAALMFPLMCIDECIDECIGVPVSHYVSLCLDVCLEVC